MNKHLKKVIGSFGGAMAVTVLLAVPTYADAEVNYNTNDNQVGIVTIQSQWKDMMAANVNTYAHIREEGTLEAQIVGVIYRGGAGTILERGEEWTKVTSGNVTGYIRNDLFITEEEAKELYEETFEVTDVEVEKLEHTALDLEQWSAKKEVERQAAEEEAKKQEEKQAQNVSGGELSLLAAIIQCEAGGESYEGKIAVGAVIMNRMNSGKFPNSITDVVYQSGQFSPVASGILSRTLNQGARNDCYEAAQDVLAGANNVGDCLYFNSGSGKGIQIGNQHFY